MKLIFGELIRDLESKGDKPQDDTESELKRIAGELS